jgi:hypothetical protein
MSAHQKPAFLIDPAGIELPHGFPVAVPEPPLGRWIMGFHGLGFIAHRRNNQTTFNAAQRPLGRSFCLRRVSRLETPPIVVIERVGAFALLGFLFAIAYPEDRSFVIAVVFGSAVLLELLNVLRRVDMLGSSTPLRNWLAAAWE